MTKPKNFISLADRKKKTNKRALAPLESPISSSIGQLFDVTGQTHLRLNSGKIETKAGHYLELCEAGTPDRVFFDCLAVFVEVKRPGESLRPDQVKKIRELREKGAVVCVCRDALEAQKVLKILARYRAELEVVRHIAGQIQLEINALGFDR